MRSEKMPPRAASHQVSKHLGSALRLPPRATGFVGAASCSAWCLRCSAGPAQQQALLGRWPHIGETLGAGLPLQPMIDVYPKKLMATEIS